MDIDRDKLRLVLLFTGLNLVIVALGAALIIYVNLITGIVVIFILMALIPVIMQHYFLSGSRTVK